MLQWWRVAVAGCIYTFIHSHVHISSIITTFFMETPIFLKYYFRVYTLLICLFLQPLLRRTAQNQVFCINCVMTCFYSFPQVRFPVFMGFIQCIVILSSRYNHLKRVIRRIIIFNTKLIFLYISYNFCIVIFDFLLPFDCI